MPTTLASVECCPTCHQRLLRSGESNRKYWALLHRIAEELKPDGHSYSPEQWHLWCKSRWLGMDDVHLPNGRIIHVPRSSRLPADEFGLYLDQVEAWAATRGVYLDEVVE